MYREASIPSLPIFFYNTESRTKEKFSVKEKKILMYTCGPTVYDYAHLGNFRTYIFEDLLKRTLQFFGYEVFHVMNLTDVDDKTINGAIKQQISLDEFTAPYITAFFDDIARLGISPASNYPRATHYIKDMIQAIEQLKNDGFAYIGHDNSIYFSIDKLPTYGRLCNLNPCQSYSRIDSDEYDKENACDFTLWKAYNPKRDGNIFWDSPFGRGRPGWHLECSIMAMKLLGPTIDIHAGGVDNIFPHHENEIAQSESLSKNKFVRYWLHSEHLLVDGKKMSKSLGNFYRLDDLLKQKFSGMDVRYMLMQSHYRTQLNFTHEALQGCQQAIKKLQDFVNRLETISKERPSNYSENVQKCTDTLIVNFSQAIANDLNISEALASLFHFVKSINSLENVLGYDEASLILNTLQKVNYVLNILSFNKNTLEIPEAILKLVKEREVARNNKEWKKSDDLRELVAKQGFLIEDTKNGYRIKKLLS